MSGDEGGNGASEARGRLTEKVNVLEQQQKELRLEFRECLTEIKHEISGLKSDVGLIRQILSTVGIITTLVWTSSERLADFIRGLFK